MASSSPARGFSVKRKSGEDTTNVNKKPLCQYGKDCYRKNPQHFREFFHTSESGVKRVKVDAACCIPSGNLFTFTKVKGIDDQYNAHGVAIDIADILSKNCEKLEETVQFNYCFDVPWLVKQYPLSVREKPLLLVHGNDGKDKLDIEAEAMNYKHIDLVQAKLPIPFGTHHSKMMFLLYTDGLKVVIHTANLVTSDWHQKTQGVWMSPLFVKKQPTYCEEKDSFRKDLVEYLTCYKSSKLSNWINKIGEYDMTNANVHLIASVPGRHLGKAAMNKWGHLKLRQVLSEHGPEKSSVSRDWPVVGQFSSIGSLGEDSEKWLCSEWLRSLACCKGEKFMSGLGKCANSLKLIYPTNENVRNSLEGYSAGQSLPYGVKTAMKQRYIKEYLCQWVATESGRSLASPHIKSFTRISPDSKSAAWFLLTSANLSKAAWGVYEKQQTQLMIRSYEIGVLFIPKQKGDNNGTALFKLDSSTGGSGECLRLPYDTPLTPYAQTDKPWVWDIKYTKEDSHGRIWDPSRIR